MNIVEDNFVKKNSSSYNLSILVGMDRFSYAIMDEQKNLLALKSYLVKANQADYTRLHAALQDIFIEDKILKLPFRETTVGLINNANTLIPNKLYQPEALNTYLKNQIPSLKKHQVFVDQVETLDAKNVYAFDQEVYYLVKGYLPQAKFVHSSTCAVQSFLLEQGEQAGKNVYVNVKGDHLQIAFVDGKEMIYFNAFPFESEHDFLYYVLLVLKQFTLPTESTPIFLSGQITDDSKIYRMLYQYIGQIHFAKTPTSIHLGKKYKGTPAHFYYDLFSLGLCAS